MLTASSAATTPHPATLAHKTFVVAHHELRFQLLHRIHRDADHDQKRRTAKIELNAQAVENGAATCASQTSCRPTSKCCRWIPEIIHSGIKQTMAR